MATGRSSDSRVHTACGRGLIVQTQAEAKAAGYGRDIQNDAAEIKIEAEAKAGTLLAKIIPHGGGRPSKELSHDATVLEDFGINRSQSSRWQRIARVPEDVRAEHIAKVRQAGEVTSASILKLER